MKFIALEDNLKIKHKWLSQYYTFVLGFKYNKFYQVYFRSLQEFQKNKNRELKN